MIQLIFLTCKALCRQTESRAMVHCPSVKKSKKILRVKNKWLQTCLTTVVFPESEAPKSRTFAVRFSATVLPMMSVDPNSTSLMVRRLRLVGLSCWICRKSFSWINSRIYGVVSWSSLTARWPYVSWMLSHSFCFYRAKNGSNVSSSFLATTITFF